MHAIDFTIVGLHVIALILGGLWFWFRHLSSSAVADMPSNETSPAGDPARS